MYWLGIISVLSWQVRSTTGISLLLSLNRHHNQNYAEPARDGERGYYWSLLLCCSCDAGAVQDLATLGPWPQLPAIRILQSQAGWLSINPQRLLASLYFPPQPHQHHPDQLIFPTIPGWTGAALGRTIKHPHYQKITKRM